MFSTISPLPTMGGSVQSSTSIPTRANLLDEITALRLEIDAANKKIRRCNDTILSQADELTILRNIICQNCKCKLLDALFDSSSSGLAPIGNFSFYTATKSSTSVAANPTSTDPQSTPFTVSVQPTWEVQNSQSSAQLNPSNNHQARRSTSFELERTPQHAPPFRTTVTTNTTFSSPTPRDVSGSSSSKTDYSVVSFPNPTRPLPTVPLPAIPVPFHPTRKVPTTQSSSRLIVPTSLSQPPQAGASAAFKRTTPHHCPPPEQSRKRQKSGAVSLPRKPEHNPAFPWSVTHGLRADKMLEVTFKRAFSYKKRVNCVKFSLDSKYVAIGLSGLVFAHAHLNGEAIVYSTKTGKQVCRLVENTEEYKSGVCTMCFSPNGRQLAIGHDDGHINIWLIASKRLRNVFGRNRMAAVINLDFSPNGRSIVSSDDYIMHMWSVRDGFSRVWNNETINYAHWHRCVKFSPNGNHVAAVQGDGFLRIWDSRTLQLVVKWQGHDDFLSSLAFTPDGKGLVSGSVDGTIKYWSVTPLRDSQSTMKDAVTLLHEFEHKNAISSIAITADGQWLLSGSHDRTASIWNISNGSRQCSFSGHSAWVSSVDISRVGNYFIIGGGDNQVSLWEYKVIGNRG